MIFSTLTLLVIIEFVFFIFLQVLIRKGAFNHSLVHTVIYNYLLVAEPKQKAETIEQLREALVHMAHSRFEDINVCFQFLNKVF